MLATWARKLNGSRPSTARESNAAAASWENEGGAIKAAAPATPPVVGHQPGWDTPTPRQDVAIDVRQDDLMGVASPDGQPPTHRLRRLEWWWLAIVASALAAAGLALLLVRGVDWGTVLGASGLLLVLIAAASPVWGAALLRGREERLARRKAREELNVPIRITAGGTPPAAAPFQRAGRAPGDPSF